MHGRKMIVKGQRLNEWIMIAEFRACRSCEAMEGHNTLLPSLDPAVTGCSKGDILITTSKSAWRTVIVVAPGDDPSMNLEHELLVDGLVDRDGCDPAIRRHRCSGLPL